MDSIYTHMSKINPYFRAFLILAYMITLLTLMVLIDSVYSTFLFIAGAGILLYILLNEGKNHVNNQEKSFQEAMSLLDIQIDRSFLGDDLFTGIAISEKEKKVIIFSLNEENKYEQKAFGFDEVLESELLKDGRTITKSSKGSVLSGALVGCIVAGGVGALIGGLNSKKSTEDVSGIELKVTVNSITNPVHTITFIQNGQQVNHNNRIKYKQFKDEAYEWHKILSLMMDDNVNKESI